MQSKVTRYVLKPVSRLFKGLDIILTKLFRRRLKEQVLGEVTDKFIGILLDGMDWFYTLTWDRDVRRNLENFNGRYLFTTASGTVRESATFSGGQMHVHHDRAIDDWDVKITFRNAGALRDFILKEDPDIFDAMSKNEVDVDGNLNDVYKLGYMARDILRRLNWILP